MWLNGVCRLNPPFYLDGEWTQPQTKEDDVCSHFHKRHGNVTNLDGPDPHHTVTDFISVAKQYKDVLGGDFEGTGMLGLKSVLNVIYEMGSIHNESSIEGIVSMPYTKWSEINGVGPKRFGHVQNLFHRVVELMGAMG